MLTEAGCEPIEDVKINRRYYLKEVINDVHRLQAQKVKTLSMSKRTKGELSPLEQSRNETVMIKNAQLKKTWGPIAAFEMAIAAHNAKNRTIFMSIKPQMQRKYGDVVPIDMMNDLEDFLSRMMNNVAELKLDDLDTELEKIAKDAAV